MTRFLGSCVLSFGLLTGLCWVYAEEPQRNDPAMPATRPVSVALPAAEGAIKYFEVPVFGNLGVDVTPEALELAFNEAELAQAKYVILLFDSPGGDPTAVSAMIRSVSSHPKVTTVAFVRRATGNAALFAASCAKLHIYKAGLWGVSGITECQQVQACQTDLDRIIAANRRNSLVLKAIADWNSELYLSDDGKQVILNPPTVDKTRAIKQRDSGLILAPQDMVNCQIADAVCANMGDVRRELGVENWVSCGNRGAEIIQGLSRTPEPVVINMTSPESGSPKSRGQDAHALERDKLYYEAQRDAQQRAYDERKRIDAIASEERRRREDEALQAENRAKLREQDRQEKLRKQREMDAVGQSFRQPTRQDTRVR